MKRIVVVLTAVLALWAVAPGLTPAAEQHPLVGRWTWTWNGVWEGEHRSWLAVLEIRDVAADGEVNGQEIVTILPANVLEYHFPFAGPLASAEARYFTDSKGRTVLDVSRNQVFYRLVLSKDGKTLSGIAYKPFTGFVEKALFTKQ